MPDLTIDRTPMMRTVAVEQLRVVGLAIRREAIAAWILLGLPLSVAAIWRHTVPVSASGSRSARTDEGRTGVGLAHGARGRCIVVVRTDGAAIRRSARRRGDAPGRCWRLSGAGPGSQPCGSASPP